LCLLYFFAFPPPHTTLFPRYVCRSNPPIILSFCLFFASSSSTRLSSTTFQSHPPVRYSYSPPTFLLFVLTFLSLTGLYSYGSTPPHAPWIHTRFLHCIRLCAPLAQLPPRQLTFLTLSLAKLCRRTFGCSFSFRPPVPSRLGKTPAQVPRLFFPNYLISSRAPPLLVFLFPLLLSFAPPRLLIILAILLELSRPAGPPLFAFLHLYFFPHSFSCR